MKIVVHTPYAGLSRESGLIYLTANYLNGYFSDIVQLRCNGVFSLCDRDEESNWRRDASSCAACIKNQSQMAEWSSLAYKDLSRFLSAEEIRETRRLMHATPDDGLRHLNFKGLNIYELCRGSFFNRLGTEQPDMMNKKHAQLMRRIMISALRMCMATRRFNNHFMPDLTIVAGGRDYITKALAGQSAQQKRDVAVFGIDINTRSIRIRHPREDKYLSSQLILPDIMSMRADSKTWPAEIVSAVEEILAFLDIPATQINLPLAK